MKCLSCHSTELRKNGRRYDKQCFQCKHCGRQFVDERTPVGYYQESEDENEPPNFAQLDELQTFVGKKS